MSLKADAQSQSLTNALVASLSRDINSGKYPVGERLPNEATLQELFDVSRSVVRDATKILVGQGVLELRRGVGVFVRQTTTPTVIDRKLVASMVELYEVRKALETHASGWCAERRTQNELINLQKNITSAQDSINKGGTPTVLVQFDNDFHLSLARCAHNNLLFNILQSMMELLMAARVQSLSIPGRPAASVRDHARIVKAIEIGDPDEAHAAMLDHLTSVERAILQSLTGRRP